MKDSQRVVSVPVEACFIGMQWVRNILILSQTTNFRKRLQTTISNSNSFSLEGSEICCFGTG